MHSRHRAPRTRPPAIADPRRRSPLPPWLLPAIAVITGWRLLVGAAAGLGDVEAYYWTWSTQLDWSYLDHGPLVAVLIRLGTAVGGVTPLAVRLPFIVLSSITLVSAALLAARLAVSDPSRPAAAPDAPHELAADHAAAWAIVVLLAMPAVQIAGAAANPDVPLVACTVLFIGALLHGSDSGALRWFAAAGLLAGLATSAKLFGLALAVPLVLVAAAAPRGRAAAALACSLGALLAGAAPVIVWNAGNDWATLTYHLGSRHSEPAGLSLLNLGKLLGGQLGYVSPVVLGGLLAAATALWRRRRHDANARLLLWTALPLAGGAWILIALVPGAEPHWPLAGYVPLVLALACRLPTWYQAHRGVRLAVRIGVVFSGVAFAAAHLHVLTDLGLRVMPASYEPRYDLSNELRGWRAVASAVARAVRRDPSLRVVGCHYTVCAQLAFAGDGRFAVRCPSPRLDQFDFFPGGDGATALIGSSLLYVRDERFPFDADQMYRCRSVDVMQRVVIRRAGRAVRTFELQRCSEFAGLRAPEWPPPS